MPSSDSPRYRRTGPIDVQPAAQRPRRRLRRRWIAVFAVIIGVQGGWVSAVALAQNEPSAPPASSTSAASQRSVSASTTKSESASPSASAKPSVTPRGASSPPSTPSSRTTKHDAAAAGSAPASSAPGSSGPLFAADSPWNTTIASGATYSSSDSAVTRSLIAGAGRATINSRAWSVPVAIATSGDPQVEVSVASGTTAAHRMPTDADPSNDTDSELAVIDGSHSYEYWGLTGSTTSGWSARYGAVVDLSGSGTTGGVRASGFSLLGGLIRERETTGPIDHALVVALAAGQLHTGPISPARSEDGDANATYSGEVHMGQRVAIPRSVDLDALHLSPAGLRLARALQIYGAFVGDRSSQLTLYAQPEAEGPQLAAMRTALSTELAPLLRAVSTG